MLTAARQTFVRRVTPLEWIGSTGGQYVDTGVSFRSGRSYTVDFQLTTIPQKSNYYSIASSEPVGSTRVMFRVYGGNFCVYGATNSGPTNIAAVDLSRHVWRIDYAAKKIYFDGTVTSFSWAPPAFDRSLTLFANNYGPSNTIIQASKCRIFRFTATEAAGTTLCDLVPARKGRTVSVFDRVARRLVSPGGSATLIAGPRGGSLHA